MQIFFSYFKAEIYDIINIKIYYSIYYIYREIKVPVREETNFSNEIKSWKILLLFYGCADYLYMVK